jgi:nitrous oxidase accessory protein NosD
MERRLEASWAAVDVVSSRILKVPSQYSTIQAALAEASAGDTIEVASGIYREDLLINKNYLKIVGEERTTTVIDANMQGSPKNATVYINGSNVLFSGFTVRDGSGISGITVNGENATILENNIVNNTVGIRLLASRSKIVKNNINDNFEGVWVHNNIGNHKLYYNSFFNNTRHFYQQPPPQGANAWGNGYAGNYWSNYTGVDVNGDGIGDTSHVIDSNNVDHYPLMSPYLYGDTNHDGKIDIRDVSFVARRFGCTPIDPLWNPAADINEDSKIDIKDVSTVARRFGDSI